MSLNMIQVKGVNFALHYEDTVDGEDGQLLVWAELVDPAGRYMEHSVVATRHMEDAVEPYDFVTVATGLAYEIVDDILEALKGDKPFYLSEEEREEEE